MESSISQSYPGASLCFGDQISLLVKVVEGCPHGGFLSSEDIKISTQRFISVKDKGLDHAVSRFDSIRLLGVSAITEKDKSLSCPSNFFLGCVFEIVAGIGFDSPGSRVSYGSQIKLRLVATEEYLSVDKDMDLLQLIPRKDFEKNRAKECNFKIKPRYQNIHNEGDPILYQDLVCFSDFLGREIYCTSSNRIILSKNFVSGFSVTPFVPHSRFHPGSLRGGDVIQLYHRVESCFLLATRSHPQTPDASVSAFPQKHTLLSKCNSFWQIETIVPHIHNHHMSGLLYHGTHVYLKNLASNKYLSVINGALVLSTVASHNTAFELHLNIDRENAACQDLDRAHPILSNALIRIFHPKSKKYLILDRTLGGSEEVVQEFVFSCSSSSYEKDVYQTIKVSSADLDVLIFGQRLLDGLSHFVHNFELNNLPAAETQILLSRATNRLSSLSNTSKHGYLDIADNKLIGDKVPLSYDVCVEMGIVAILLKLSKFVFDNAKKSSRSGFVEVLLSSGEESLVKETYAVLKLLLNHDINAANHTLAFNGLSLMIEHLAMMPNYSWAPPMMEFIRSIHQFDAESRLSKDLMTDFDIEKLLNAVDSAILGNKDPDPFIYTFLARVCLPKNGSDLISVSSRQYRADRKMQMKICRQLLGSPFGAESPGWSSLIYRTAVELVEDGDAKAPQIFLSRSSFGRRRPIYRKDQPHPFAGPIFKDDEQKRVWVEAMELKSALLSPLVKQSCSSLADVSRILPGIADDSILAYIGKFFLQTEWKPLSDLTSAELKFYCATLDLLSSLCAGRNRWTQRVVRRLIPVDHILLILQSIDTLKELHQIRYNQDHICLLPLKTAIIDVLISCYIDSAYLPPLPTTGKQPLGSSDPLILRDSLKTWDGAFYNECAAKVFGLFSQLDFNQLKVSDDMSVRDLHSFVSSIDIIESVDYSTRQANPGNSKIPLSLYNEAVIQLQNSVGSLEVKEIVNMIENLSRLQSTCFYELSHHCLEQRAILHNIAEDLINTEVYQLWKDFIQDPLLKLLDGNMESLLTSSRVSLTAAGDFLSTAERNFSFLIGISIDYLTSALKLVQSLTLIQFFDPDYNANPLVSSRPSSKEAEGSNLPYLYSTSTNAPFFFAKVGKYSGQERLVLRVGTQGDARGVPELSGKAQVMNSDYGDLKYVRDISDNALNMLRYWPAGQVVESRFGENDDEKLVGKYFRSHFGYYHDPHGLIHRSLAIRRQCCCLLSISLDLLHFTTASELKEIFEIVSNKQISVKESFSNKQTLRLTISAWNKNDSKMTSALLALKRNKTIMRSIRSFRKQTMSYEELKAFRANTWTELQVKAVRRPDLIWNVPNLFNEDMYKALMHSILFNSRSLRAEAINLIYRISAHRSELAQYLLKELRAVGSHDEPLFIYLSQQRLQLLRILDNFDRFLDEGFDHDGEATHTHIQAEVKIKISKLMASVDSLKQLLFRQCRRSKELGLLPYLFSPASKLKTTRVPINEDSSKANLTPGIVSVAKVPMRLLDFPESVQSSLWIFRGGFEISIKTPIELIYSCPANRYHQKVMVDMEFHKILETFILNNAPLLYKRGININDSSFSPSRISPEIQPLVEVFRYSIRLLKCIILDNSTLTEIVGTKALITSLLNLRHVLDDGVDFLETLIRTNPMIVNYVGNAEFIALVNDIEAAVLTVPRDFKAQATVFNAGSLGKVISLVKIIILSEAQSSRNRLNYFANELINVMDNDKYKDTLLQRVFSLGVKFELNDPVAHLSKGFDVKFTCFSYHVDTTRVTFCRLPKDILADAIITSKVYPKMKRALISWRLLSDKSSLKLHLDMIAAIGTIAVYNKNIQQTCASFASPIMVILTLLMIDKYEIRYSWLLFLYGVWFSENDDSISNQHSKIVNDQTKVYFQALLFSFAQDMRLLFLLLDDSKLGKAAPEDLGMLPLHVKLLESYIKDAVLPLMAKLINSNILTQFDEIENSDSSVHDPPHGSFVSMTKAIAEITADILLKNPESILIHSDDDNEAIISLLGSNKYSLSPLRRVAIKFLRRMKLRYLENDDKPDLEQDNSWANLRNNCLAEFVPEVDLLASTNGYTSLDNLIHAPTPTHVFVGDKEHVIPPFSASNDVHTIATSLNVSPLAIVTNPMNCAGFRYLQREISNMFLSYSTYLFPDRCKQLLHTALSASSSNSPELFILPRENNLAIKKNDSSRINPTVARADALLYQWSKKGGMVVESIFDHMLYSINIFLDGRVLDGTLGSYEDIIRCNAYWCNVFTKGVLRDRAHDIAEHYQDQTDLQLKKVRMEESRLHLTQEIFKKLGAVDLVVTQLSASRKIHGISREGVLSLQNMAIDMGTALNSGGNKLIQKLLISKVEEDFRFSVSRGHSFHFISVIKSIFRTYSLFFTAHFSASESSSAAGSKRSTRSALDGRTFDNIPSASQTSDQIIRSNADEVIRLLHFLAMICEGHSRSVQQLLGSHKIVGEVANFVSEMTKLLADEMNFWLLTEEELPVKHRPTVCGRQRGAIKWIHPLPFASGDDDNSRKRTLKDKLSNYRLLNIKKLGILSEIVTAGLNALTEFCQGPNVENQLIISRAGATREFSTFFEFWGAYQLVSKYEAKIFKTARQKKSFSNVFHDEMKMHASFQSVSPLSSESELCWYGNDPLSFGLYFSIMSKSSTVESRSEVRHSLRLPTKENKAMKRVNGMFSLKEYDDITDLLKASKVRGLLNRDITSLAEWSNDKNVLIEYRKHVEKVTESLEGNLYTGIFSFEALLVSLESATLKLALSLLEGSSGEISEIPLTISESIGAQNLICNMANYWNRFLNYDAMVSSCDPISSFERQMAHTYYQVVRRIVDTNVLVDCTQLLKDMLVEWLQETGVEIDEHIARIEVRIKKTGSEEKDSSLCVAYFPIPPVVHKYWSRGDIKEFRKQIIFPSSGGTRDSAEEKVKCFITDGRDLIATLRHLENLDELCLNRGIVVRVLVGLLNNLKLWADITLFIGLALNVLLLLSAYSVNGETATFEIRGWRYQRAIRVLGAFLLVSTSAATASYLIMKGWLFARLGLENNPSNEFSVDGFWVSRIAMALNFIGLLGVQRSRLEGNILRFNTSNSTAISYYLLQRLGFWYYLFLFIFALLGRFHSPLFYSACLLELLRVSKIMQYVSRAFTANLDQVLATIGLAIIIMYLFVSVSFANDKLHNQYSLNGEGEAGCYSLQSCFRLHLDYGMSQSVLWKYPVAISTAVGEFYNFGFVFIIQIVIPGLISGIIIDTFSEMRGNKKAIEEDVRNTCMICSIDREDFETSGYSFEDHIKNDHNMWKYIWFMVYLEEKNRKQYDGIEDSCASDIRKTDESMIRWLPIKCARALSSVRDKYDFFTIYNKLTALQGQVDSLEGKLRTQLVEQELRVVGSIKGDSDVTKGELKDIFIDIARELTGQNISVTRKSSAYAL